MNNFGKEVREFRKVYNLSQKELCKEICPISHLNCIENNKIEARPEIIQLLSERMKVIKSNNEVQNDNIPNKNIGEFFFKERLKHGITQEILCYGICTASYLSKIENNKLAPSLNIKKSLYKRLIKIKNNTKTVDIEILELEKLYDNMISLFDKGKVKDAKKMLHRGLQSTKDKYPKLYYLFSYQTHLYFDPINLTSFLETIAIPFFKNQRDNK